MEHNDLTTHECFQYNEETRSQLDKLESRHDELARRVFEKLEKLDEKLMMRLPIWATMFLSFLTLLVGGLLTKLVSR